MFMIALRCPNADLEAFFAHESVKELVFCNSEGELSVEIGTQTLDGLGMFCLKVIQVDSGYDQRIVDR